MIVWMKRVVIIFFLKVLFIFFSVSQHCAPITKTILNEVSISRVNNSLNFQFEFIKNGGQIKDAYQLYLIAYLEKNKSKVFKESQKASNGKHLMNIYNEATTVILNRDIIKQSLRYDKIAGGTIYGYAASLNLKDISKKIILHGNFKKQDDFLGKFKVAVFIPFLDDKEYSVDLLQLPNDTHECNYDGRSALILQELDYTFKIYTRNDDNTKESYFIILEKK